MRFIALSSGSKQNCYYIESEEDAVLVDMGVSYPALLRFLQESGGNPGKIRALFVTHEHQDHINGMRSFLRNSGLPVYIHEKSRLFLDYRLKNHLDIHAFQGIKIGKISITPFPVSHDAANTFGFILDNGKKKMFLASDVGTIDPCFQDLCHHSNLIAIESNYDPEMLKNSRYPEYLKTRISGKTGHLSNPEAYDFVTLSAEERTGHVAFLHLSENNNSVDLLKNDIKTSLNFRHPSIHFHITRRDGPIQPIDL